MICRVCELRDMQYIAANTGQSDPAWIPLCRPCLATILGGTLRILTSTASFGPHRVDPHIARDDLLTYLSWGLVDPSYRNIAPGEAPAIITHLLAALSTTL